MPVITWMIRGARGRRRRSCWRPWPGWPGCQGGPGPCSGTRSRCNNTFQVLGKKCVGVMYLMISNMKYYFIGNIDIYYSFLFITLLNVSGLYLITFFLSLSPFLVNTRYFYCSQLEKSDYLGAQLCTYVNLKA